MCNFTKDLKIISAEVLSEHIEIRLKHIKRPFYIEGLNLHKESKNISNLKYMFLDKIY